VLKKILKKFYMNKVYDWFEERLEVQAIADDFSSKYVPPHVNIFYCFGGLVLTCFLIQVATGFAMTFYYRPSVVDAFASVEYIMTSVNFGWLIRSVHRWSASMMVRAVRSWMKIINFYDSIQGEDVFMAYYAKA
jgi:cytochrome b6